MNRNDGKVGSAGSGMCIGMCIGISVGAALGYLSAGVVLGVCLGLALDRGRKGSEVDDAADDTEGGE